jgi:hypothetical protein
MKDIIELLNLIVFDQDFQDNEYVRELMDKITKEYEDDKSK